MFALILVAALLAAAQAADPYYGKPVECCKKARQYVADTKNRCVFYQCQNSNYGITPGYPQYCAPGTALPDGYKIGLSNPCTKRIYGYDKCTRDYPLIGPSYCDPHPPIEKPRCFDCSAEFPYGPGGFPACLLKYPLTDAPLLDKWTCPGGRCFIRFQETKDYHGNVKKFIFRGCANQELVGDQINTDPKQNCKIQNGYKWWFCDGDCCNKKETVCGH